ncbi:hypothetical protein IMZ48_46080, partial [Candidatus Bathyarchaeota archaeon]|nr:hypothetical protein [Candidatus Bathyarchaeota archaeon]
MPEYHGSLVAFEGPADVISTQLRLLPTSPQILILPSVQSYLPSEPTEGAFKPATYLRRVHDAAATRTAVATSFLRDATLESKRLVFLHGGTPSAYALCIDALAEHETRGDRQGAESLFRELISSGLQGLSSRKTRQRNQRGLVLDEFALFQAQFQDPITRAMRAADALDKQTAALQPDIDFALSQHRPRSMSLPVYGYVDNLGDSAPFYVFGAKNREESGEEAVEDEGFHGRSFFLQSPRLEPGFLHDDVDEIDPLEPLRRPSVTPQSPSCMGESYQRPRYPSIAMDDDQSVMEAGDVVFGEASLVRMSKEMPRRSVRRVVSLDMVAARRASCRDPPLRHLPIDLDEETLESLRRFSCLDIAPERLPMSPVSPRTSVVGSPKTVFVKSARSSRRASTRPARASYVDRGSHAEEDTSSEGKAFQQVLPFSEDMVLYFKDEAPDPKLGSLVESFRAGTYPPQPRRISHDTRRASALEQLAGSTHRLSTPPRSEEGSSVAEFMETITRSIALDEEYDPFAYDKSPTWSAPQKTNTSLSPTITPPTPSRTPPPPPVIPEIHGGKITDFDTSGCHTAVALQNALRPLLE